MFEERDAAAARPLWMVAENDLESWLAGRTPEERAWVAAMNFRGERHQVVVLPGESGSVRGAALGLGPLNSLERLELWHCAGAADRLPAGAWRIENPLPVAAATAAALGWAYGSYRFERFRSKPRAAPAAVLVPPQLADMAHVRRVAAALAMARNLINLPAGELTPERLAHEALEMATRCGAEGRVLVGDALRDGYPAVHAVGQASAIAPRLVDFSWGDPAAPKVTLVGKGVCFDSGGLDLKAAAGMLLMKKDMGGAACALALARVVMESGLPVRLRVLLPTVENAVAGNAYRPGDVLSTRKGISVEVGNTDAEGRLILADALAAGDADGPDLLVDFATLTGAARIALGPDLPALFGNRDATVQALVHHGRRLADPLWPMPLWDGYDDEFSSKVADINNVSGSTFAGAIIGGLFLRRFVSPGTDWLHLDLFGWNPKERPGRPVGAEPQTVRAVHALLVERYG
jgi:leucyl aminopeptidase